MHQPWDGGEIDTGHRWIRTRHASQFMVTSRDTTQISKVFHHNFQDPPKIFPLHDVETSIVQGDIKKYLQNSLSEIRRNRKQPLPWPAPDKLEFLLKRSDRLFIYAATVIRFLGKDDGELRRRLAYITRPTPGGMYTEAIDSLYNGVMKKAFHKLIPDEVSARREIVSTVIFLLVPLSMNSIASLLSMDSSQPRTHLAPFQSVILIRRSGY